MRVFWFCLLLLLSSLAQAQLSEQAFNRPDATHAPRVHWLWRNGQVDKEGINLDLEALAATGMGGGTLFTVSDNSPKGPIRYNSAAWTELIVHALQQADRLGLTFDLYAAAGASGIGGPWITPDHASQQLVWRELVLKGGEHQVVQLPTPSSNQGVYMDVAVLACPAQKTVDLSKIVDLSAQVSSEGKLDWNVPTGDWIVVRFGSTVIGGTGDLGGLEADLLSRNGIQQHYDAFLKPLLEQTKTFHGRSLIGLSMNVQLGSQNWTSQMLPEFLKRAGYDLKPFLLAFTGRHVSSTLETERFRWDFQRVQSEMMEEFAVSLMRDLLQRQGLMLHTSPFSGASCMTVQAEISALKQKMDSIASEPTFSSFYLAYEHIPLTWTKNAVAINSTSSNYSRDYCLFSKLTDCFDYSRRIRYVLQNARPVADGACFLGEGVSSDSPCMPGYVLDELSREELLKQAKVSDHQLRLADGRSYRFLALPAVKAVSLPLLRTLKTLLEDGLWLSAQKPTNWVGRLTAKEQTEWKRLVDELWSKLPDGVYRYGAGRLFINIPVQGLLAEIKRKPDFVSTSTNDDSRIRFRHLRSGTDEIWFISNPSDRIDTLMLGFRITGAQPEWWNAETGQIHNLDILRQNDDQTLMPLILQPLESGFVVFRKGIDKPVYDGISKDGFLLFGANPDVFPDHLSIGILPEEPDSDAVQAPLPAWLTLKDNYLFRKRGRYARLNPGAAYKQQPDLELKKDLFVLDLSTNWCFNLNAKDLLGYQFMLDLGTVHGVVEIYVNGKSVGRCWKKPYRLDVTNLLKLGENQLEIQKTNCLGAERQPAELIGPITLSAWKVLKK